MKKTDLLVVGVALSLLGIAPAGAQTMTPTPGMTSGTGTTTEKETTTKKKTTHKKRSHHKGTASPTATPTTQ